MSTEHGNLEDLEVSGPQVNGSEPIALPNFRVANLWQLFEEGYEDFLQAGLIALAMRCHIDEVNDSPMTVWDKEAQIFRPTQIAEYFQQVGGQFRDTGTLERNEFTGLATLHLKVPIEGYESVSFVTIPTPRDVALSAGGNVAHDLEKSALIISRTTRMPMDSIHKLYIGDYVTLREEADRLSSALSSG